MTGTDQIALFDDADLRHRTAVHPWPHPWPPWERLAVLEGIVTGVKGFVKIPEGVEELTDGAARMGTTVEAMYHRTDYVRVTYSELPEDIALDPTSHVCRMAGYVKVIPMAATDEVNAIDGSGF